jgi:ribonucleoside-diphosphate reductase alpha chain
LNLVKFYDAERGSFRIDDYRHAIRLWTVGLEISVLMAQFPSQEIAKLSYDYRTLGLGYANIGSLLMRMGIPYDDPRGSAICGALTAIMGGVAYATSAEMAGVMGPFSRYEENEEHMLRVIRNHRRAAYATEADEYEGLTVKPMQIDSKKCPRELLEAAREAWDRALMLGEEHGYRNAQVTVIAPTGTIGLVMDCDTTGIEPDFSLVKFKSLAGGGMLRIINQAVPQALQRLGYDRNQIEDISSYVLGSGNLSGSVGITHQSLVEKGFSEEELAKLDAACDAVFDVRSLFSPTILGHQFYKSTLGVTEEELDNPFFDTLGYLGFNSTEIEIANEKVFGRLSIEGAPHLDDKHLAVFDCATACGKHGTRSIAWQAHVNMMAAAQPFISGAISKTINMPNEISVAEIKAAYKSAWETMNKACAIYRDGSKLSQPLMSSIIDTAVVEEESDDSDMMSVSDVVEQMSERIPVPKEEARKLSTRIVERYIATRRRLPDSGAGFRQKAKVGGHTVYLHTFDYENDELGEMFISMSKEGAAFRSLMNCFAISVSLGLQYGVPLEEYVESFVFTRFEPDGMVQGSKRVKMATSIIDYIFRELAIRYLGRNDLAHVSEEDIRHDAVSIPKLTEEGVVRGHGKRRDVQLRLDTIIKDESETSAEVTGNPQIKVMTEARERGFTGDMCDDCGAMTMVRNGTCLKCESCGATTGCS